MKVSVINHRRLEAPVKEAQSKATIATLDQMIFKFNMVTKLSFFPLCISIDVPPIPNKAAATKRAVMGSAVMLKMLSNQVGAKNKGKAKSMSAQK